MLEYLRKNKMSKKKRSKTKKKPELKLSPIKVKWHNKPNPKELSKYVGFVYIVTELDSGMKYIGLKRFWFKTTTYHTRKPTKVEATRLLGYKNKGYVGKYSTYKATLRDKYMGQKVRTKGLVESDWEHYATSNVYLNSAIPKNPDNYEMNIIRWCVDITTLKAYEAYLILEAYTKFDFSQYYNGHVSVKLRLR